MLLDFLTPKGLDCVFWQYRNFGHVCGTRDLHVLGLNLIECVDDEYLSFALKFRTIENMSQKL